MEKMIEELTKLFEPGIIGKVKVKNKIVMAAMGTGYSEGPSALLLLATYTSWVSQLEFWSRR